jgi:predicted aspartyl protease
MVFIYRYRELPGKKGARKKTPSIPVLFRGNSPTTIQVVALVDSGADLSVVPKGLAEVLNLDLTGPKQDSFGFGGKIVCIESKVSITLNQGHEKAELEIPVLVSPDDSCPAILGRTGFFDLFNITFDSKRHHLTLKRNSLVPLY